MLKIARILIAIELGAAVFPPALFVVVAADGAVFTEARGADALRRNAMRHHVALSGLGTAMTESVVVFVGTSFVAMPLDHDVADTGLAFTGTGTLRRLRGAILHSHDIVVHHGDHIAADVGLVIIEMNCFETGSFVLVGTINERRADDDHQHRH